MGPGLETNKYLLLLPHPHRGGVFLIPVQELLFSVLWIWLQVFPGDFDVFPGDFDVFPGDFDVFPGDFDVLPGDFQVFTGVLNTFPGDLDVLFGDTDEFPGDFDDVDFCNWCLTWNYYRNHFRFIGFQK